MKKVSEEIARTLLESGRYCTVCFTKRSGETRILSGRSGVRKGTKGIGLPYDKVAHGIVILHETSRARAKEDDPWRAVPLRRLHVLVADGEIFAVEH